MSQVLTYDTVVGRELRLQDRLTALRNLRPGTRLSWPEGDLSRVMFRELLSLPESIDVLRWLEAERSVDVALLAIEQSLDMAEMMYGAQNRIVSGMLTREQERQVHQSLQEKYGAMYGALLRSDEDWSADGDFPKPLSGRSGTGYAPCRSAEAAGFGRPGTVASGPPFVPCCSSRAGTYPTASSPNGRSRCLCNKRLPTPFDTSESPHPLKRSSPCKGTAN